MIGDRIKELREKQGLTQKQLSEDPRLNLNINTLASYERNIREPKIDLIVRMARYFDVTTDYLLGVSECRDYGNAQIERHIPISENAIIELKRILNEDISGMAAQNISVILESRKSEIAFKALAEIIK